MLPKTGRKLQICLPPLKIKKAEQKMSCIAISNEQFKSVTNTGVSQVAGFFLQKKSKFQRIFSTLKNP